MAKKLQAAFVGSLPVNGVRVAGILLTGQPRELTEDEAHALSDWFDRNEDHELAAQISVHEVEEPKPAPPPEPEVPVPPKAEPPAVAVPTTDAVSTTTTDAQPPAGDAPQQ